jgi:NosR/NirI family nitrous oxide reductase transcriptional regulator
MVQAIHPEGPINPNECLYCLHCQELYFDEQRCPVMVKRRERRERKAELSARMTAGLESRAAATRNEPTATEAEGQR